MTAWSGSVSASAPEGRPGRGRRATVGVPGVDVGLRRGGVGGDDRDGGEALAGPRAEVVGRRGLVELADGPDQLVRIVGKAARRHAQPVGQKLPAEAADLLGSSFDEPLVADGGGQGTVKGEASAPEMGRARDGEHVVDDDGSGGQAKGPAGADARREDGDAVGGGSAQIVDRRQQGKIADRLQLPGCPGPAARACR